MPQHGLIFDIDSTCNKRQSQKCNMHVGGQIGQPKQGVKWGFVLDQFKHVQTYRSAEQVDDN